MVKAVVLVNIEPNYSEEVFKKINSMAHVKESLMVYGEYDAVFMIEPEHTTGVQDFVKEVRKLKGITRTVTMIELIV